MSRDMGGDWKGRLEGFLRGVTFGRALALGLVVAGLVALPAVLEVRRGWRLERALDEADAALAAEERAHELERALLERAAEVVYVASGVVLERVVPQEKIEARIDALRANHPEFLAFVLVEGRGVIRRVVGEGPWRAGGALPDGSVGARAIAAARAREAVGLAAGTAIDGAFRIAIAAPVPSEVGDGVVLGVLDPAGVLAATPPPAHRGAERTELSLVRPDGGGIGVAPIAPSGLDAPLWVVVDRTGPGERPWGPFLFRHLVGGVSLALAVGALFSILLLAGHRTVTELDRRRRLERERDVLRAGLIQADRLASIGILSASVAHEINNPMTFVGNNVEFAAAAMRGRPELAEAVEALGEASGGVERIRRIVRDLNTFARGGRRRSRRWTSTR